MPGNRQDSPILAAFASPWSRSLRWLTALSLVILAGLVAFALVVGPAGNVAWVALLLLPAAVAAALAGYFTIRRYDVTPDAILVRRLGGTTRIDLDGLQEVHADPEALRFAHRTLGTGRSRRPLDTFTSERLGEFEAFGGQASRAVVLRFPRRTVVLTPAEPERLARTLEARITPPAARA
jgi:hypothetical protein